ncbi:MFS transporter [Paenibacillus sediminis]|uniref:MFS family permease n=1 Tax=Paenibacillus sediminis TaxID=664909 RepID=A0ABS4H0L0_9BACL|nr:MFS transporter [Paenibacillus sediminis]MBP1936061.1 MFS family permease [Paenibacillus sediminis]
MLIISDLKYPKHVWVLSVCALLIMAGFSFLWPLTMIYVTKVLHRSVSTAGIVLSAEAAAGILGSMLGGVLFDRIGGKKTMISALIIIVISSFLMIGLEYWLGFLIAFVAMTMFIGVIFTSISASAGMIWPEGGKKPYNLNYIFQNIGVAIGTSLGGLTSSYSFRISFFVMSLLFTSALMLSFTGLPNLMSNKIKVITESKDGHMFQMRGLIPLLLLGLGGTFVMIGYIQWQTTVPVLMNDIGFSTSSYSFLWTINGILVLGLQPFNKLIHERLNSALSQFVIGVGLFLLSFILVSFHDHYLFFLLGMVSLTLGEVIVWPSIPAFASQYAPEGRKGAYQGIINVFNYCGRLLGPILGTSLYQSWGAMPMLLVMILFQLMALAVFLLSLTLFNTKSVRLGKRTNSSI